MFETEFSTNDQKFNTEFSNDEIAFNSDFFNGGVIVGVDGASAYELAVENGFVGTVEEWLASLKGKDGRDGIDGENGKDGKTPVRGVDYYTEADKADLIESIKASFTSEQWIFTLADDTEIMKEVYVK